MPILDAINITKETCGNEVYTRALAKVHDAIREGESMADPLRATKVCDAIVVNMIDVGEETGDLDKMLIKVADNYDSDVDVLVGSLISILEPVMVVVLGVHRRIHRRRAVHADGRPDRNDFFAASLIEVVASCELRVASKSRRVDSQLATRNSQLPQGFTLIETMTAIARAGHPAGGDGQPGAACAGGVGGWADQGRPAPAG